MLCEREIDIVSEKSGTVVLLKILKTEWWWRGREGPAGSWARKLKTTAITLEIKASVN